MRLAQRRPRRPGFIERWIDVRALHNILDDCPKTLDPAGSNSVRDLIAVAKVYAHLTNQLTDAELATADVRLAS
jgi:hypothetical protein